MTQKQATDSTWVPTYCLFSVALCYLCVATDGFVSVAGPEEARILSVFTIPSAISLWCFLDASRFGKIFYPSYAWTMMFTWPIGYLAYLLWTRRAKGLLVYLAGSAVAMLVHAIAGRVAAHLTGYP